MPNVKANWILKQWTAKHLEIILGPRNPTIERQSVAIRNTHVDDINVLAFYIIWCSAWEELNMQII